MFISRLIHTIETYDPYGLHRLNGVKLVYVLFVLLFINMIFSIPNPYFYFFYLPITAMSAEVMKDRIEDKYSAFVMTAIGAALMVFLFSLLRPYPLFFLLMTFVLSMMLYLIAIKWINMMIPMVSVILSLAAYSLLYPDINANLHMVFNNAITTVISVFIIVSALYLFPLRFYYRLWLRTFIFLLQDILENLGLMLEHRTTRLTLIQTHLKFMMTFVHMLPRHLPIYSILKLTLITHQLYIRTSVDINQYSEMPHQELRSLIDDLQIMLFAIKNEKVFQMMDRMNPILLKMGHSWNYICLKK